MWGSACHQNPIKRGKCLLAFVAIAVIAMRPVSQPLQKRSRPVVQVLLPLNAVNLEAHGHQDGALVSTACANFQDLGSGRKSEQLRLPRHCEWMADGLPCSDSEGLVVVCKVHESVVHEMVARHPIHGTQHPLVGNAHLPQFAQQGLS